MPTPSDVSGAPILSMQYFAVPATDFGCLTGVGGDTLSADETTGAQHDCWTEKWPACLASIRPRPLARSPWPVRILNPLHIPVRSGSPSSPGRYRGGTFLFHGQWRSARTDRRPARARSPLCNVRRPRPASHRRILQSACGAEFHPSRDLHVRHHVRVRKTLATHSEVNGVACVRNQPQTGSPSSCVLFGAGWL